MGVLIGSDEQCIKNFTGEAGSEIQLEVRKPLYQILQQPGELVVERLYHLLLSVMGGQGQFQLTLGQLRFLVLKNIINFILGTKLVNATVNDTQHW